MSKCSPLRLVCLWDYYDTESGFHRDPALYVQGLRQRYTPSQRLLAWLGVTDTARRPRHPGRPASWLGDIDSDVTQFTMARDYFNPAASHRYTRPSSPDADVAQPARENPPGPTLARSPD